MLFKNIVGHQAIKQKLIAIINSERISHAQLFLGKEGSGNLAMALAYVQYLYCLNKTENDACGTCSSCVKVNKLVHPDIHFVFPVATNDKVKKDPVSNNFIESWRASFIENPYMSLEEWQEIAETGNKQLLISSKESAEILKILSLKTYEAPYKTMIIWYPEKMNAASANKLLKILEEPPQKTLFLLVAADIEELLPTIISRVQILKINAVDENELAQYAMEKYQVDAQKAKDIALMANGSVNELKQSLNQMDNSTYFREMFIQMMRSAFVANVPGLIDWTDEMAKIGREKQKQFLNYALHLVRESLMMNYGSNAVGKKTSQEAQFLDKFAPFVHGANCLDIIALFDEAAYHIERNGNPKPIFLDVALKLTKLLRVKQPVLE